MGSGMGMGMKSVGEQHVHRGCLISYESLNVHIGI